MRWQVFIYNFLVYFLKFTNQWFLIYTQSCTTITKLYDRKLSQSSKETLFPLVPFLLPSEAPGNHESTFCVYWFAFSENFIKIESQYMTFCFWLLSLNMMFSVLVYDTGYSLYQEFIPSYGWIIFQCVNIPHLLIHSSVDGNFTCFHFLAIMNNAVINIHIQVCVDICFHFSWVILRSRIVGSYCTLYLNSWGTNCHIVFPSGCPILHSHWQWYIVKQDNKLVPSKASKLLKLEMDNVISVWD